MTYGNIGEFANRDLPLTAWAVDAGAGNDNNKGDAAAPLLTLAELQRRFEGRRVTANTTISLVGDFTGQFLVLSCVIPFGVTVTVAGVATTVYSGTIGTFTALNATTNTPASIQDPGLVAATQVQRRFRMTSGAASGSLATGLAAIAADTIRVSQFTTTAGALATPAAGNTYVVETLDTLVQGVQIQTSGAGAFFIDALSIIGTTSNFLHDGSSLLFSFRGCRFITSVNTLIGSRCTLIACSNTSSLFLQLGRYVLHGHASFAQLTISVGASVTASVPCCWQGHRCQVSSSGNFELSGPCGFFDTGNVGGGDALFTLEVGAQSISVVTNAIVWGVGNTASFGVRVRSGAQITYQTKSTATGVTADAVVGGTNRATWAADIPYVEPANNAMIVARA